MITNSAIYDEQLRQYTISYEGIQFCWDEKPTDANLDTAKLLAVNYHKNIDTIVTFIYNEISDWYGTITIEEVKRRIGTPIIEPIASKPLMIPISFPLHFGMMNLKICIILP